MGNRKLRHLIGQVKPSPLITRSYKLDIIYTLEGIAGQCPYVKDFFFFYGGTTFYSGQEFLLNYSIFIPILWFESVESKLVRKV